MYTLRPTLAIDGSGITKVGTLTSGTIGVGFTVIDSAYIDQSLSIASLIVSGLITANDIQSNTIRAQSDTSHKIDLDPAANQIRIHPGDEPGDRYFILVGFADQNNPTMIPSVNNSGRLGHGTAYYHEIHSFEYYEYAAGVPWDEHNDLAYLENISVLMDTKGKPIKDKEGNLQYDIDTIPYFLKHKNNGMRVQDKISYSWSCLKQLYGKLKSLKEVVEQQSIIINQLKEVKI